MARPKITCHMITTLDGRLVTDRWPYSSGDLLDLYEGAATRLGADGWIVGRRTMAEYLPEAGPQVEHTGSARPDRIAAGQSGPVCVCFDRQGRLRPELLAIDGDHLVLVVSEAVTDAHVDLLAGRGVSVVFAGSDGTDISGALDRIGHAFGLTHLLLEGGGRLNGAFLDADLIDETSTILLPLVDGEAGGAAIYDGAGARGPRRLEPIVTDMLDGGAIWMRHRVLRDMEDGA